MAQEALSLGDRSNIQAAAQCLLQEPGYTLTDTYARTKENKPTKQTHKCPDQGQAVAL